MDAGALAAGAIVPEHGAVDEAFLVPAGEMADEGAEGGVGEEGAVGGVCVGGIEEVVCGGDGDAADALVGRGGGGGVEYA